VVRSLGLQLADRAEDAEVAEALQARVFVSGNILNTLDECFQLIGQKPVKATSRLHDAFVEEFHRQLAEINSPEAKRLFILATAMPGVGVLLESCVAVKVAFVERARRLIRTRAQQRMAA